MAGRTSAAACSTLRSAGCAKLAFIATRSRSSPSTKARQSTRTKSRLSTSRIAADCVVALRCGCVALAANKLQCLHQLFQVIISPPGPPGQRPMYAIISPARKWTCQFCDIVFKNGGKADHMRRVHPDKPVIARVGRPIIIPARKWTCQFCDIVCKNGGKADHMRRVHPDKPVIARVGRPCTNADGGTGPCGRRCNRTEDDGSSPTWKQIGYLFPRRGASAPGGCKSNQFRNALRLTASLSIPKKSKDSSAAARIASNPSMYLGGGRGT